MKTKTIATVLFLLALLVVGCQKDYPLTRIKAELGESIIKTNGVEAKFKQGDVTNLGTDLYRFIEAKAVKGTSIVSVNGEHISLTDSTFTVIFRAN